MRILASRLVLLLTLGASQWSFTGAQTAQPIPRGRAQANEATRKAENVEPPAQVRPSVTAADIQKQSDELLSLAQEIHTGTARAAEGLVDKDLKDKLKRIEKLSKKLRDELGL